MFGPKAAWTNTIIKGELLETNHISTSETNIKKHTLKQAEKFDTINIRQMLRLPK